MKRLIFSLALMLAATFTFANSAESQANSFANSEWQSSGSDPVAFDCTIKGTITIIFNDGTKMTLKDANITFVGVSCGQLLRELTAAS